MLTSTLSNNSSRTNSAIAHVIERVNFKKFSEDLRIASWYRYQTNTIVLFEYVHSGIYDVVAEMERIPDTTWFIHNALYDNEVENALKSLFANKPNMKLFSRRKLDIETRQPTKYREYVLEIRPELPSPILNPEIASIFDLEDEI
jgi:hypothetical protein